MVDILETLFFDPITPRFTGFRSIFWVEIQGTKLAAMTNPPTIYHAFVIVTPGKGIQHIIFFSEVLKGTAAKLT